MIIQLSFEFRNKIGAPALSQVRQGRANLAEKLPNTW